MKLSELQSMTGGLFDVLLYLVRFEPMEQY